MNYFAAPGINKAKLALSLKLKRQNSIIDYTCQLMQIDRSRLFTKGRYRPVADCKQMVWLMLRIKTGLGCVDIGKIFGVDHSTVIHGVRAIEGKLAYDRDLKVIKDTLIINL